MLLMSKNAGTPKRVIYVLKKFPRLTETFILNEILALESLGIKVQIFTLKPPDPAANHESLHQLKATVTQIPPSLILGFPSYAGALLRCAFGSSAALFGTLAAALRTVNPWAIKRALQAVWLADALNFSSKTLVHSHFGLSASTVAYYLNRLNGTPYTFTLHAKDLFMRKVNKPLLKEKIARASTVVTVSDYNIEIIREMLGAESAARVRRIYNGVNLKQISPADESPRKTNRILAVGRLIEKKGFDFLIDVCGRLKNKKVDFECRIIGSGPMRDELQAMIAAKGLSSHVQLCGPMPHEKVIDEIRQATLIAAPFRQARDGNMDALPTVLLEALAAGTPIVASRLSGIPEIVEDRVCGRLIPPDDAAAWTAAIIEMLRDEAMRADFAREGRRRAEERFDLEKNASMLAATLAEADPDQSSKQMHVGYVLTVFPRLSETFVHREILQMEKLGIKVTVFSAKRPPPNQPIHRELKTLRAKIHYLSPWWRVGHRVLAAHLCRMIVAPADYARAVKFALERFNLPNLKKFWRSAYIAHIAAKNGIDHLHCHFMTANARLTEFAVAFHRLPYSITAHAKDIYASGLSQSKVKRRLKDAAAVVTISEFNREHLLSLQPKANVRVIYNSVDPGRFEFKCAEPITNGASLRLLAVGRLVAKKGFDLLIKSAHELSRAGHAVEVRIAGEGEELNTIQALIEDLSIREKISLLGALSQDDLLNEFRWATALVAPSREVSNGDRDGMPVVILEAMALGVPVIASRLSGIPEIIRSGENGILFEPEDLSGLCDAIVELRKADLAALTRQARMDVETKYNIGNSAKELKRIIEKSVQRFSHD